MPTKKQAPHPNGRVVSVRLDDELIDRLDALSAKTQRSRSVYIKLALRAALPALERMHWEQVAAEFEDNAIDRAFHELMEQVVIPPTDPGPQP